MHIFIKVELVQIDIFGDIWENCVYDIHTSKSVHDGSKGCGGNLLSLSINFD